MIRVDGLRKSYGPLVAVDGVSFEALPGQTLGLLGPNGAGKTTTLHLLVGLLKPDAGEIHIDSDSDPTRPEVRRQIGLAPQSLSLYGDLTGEENLRFVGRLYGLRGRKLRRRVAEALARAELADRGGDLVKTYSGGMKRRLQLVCALLHEPQVLLLDEPTIGVDPQARHHILQDIESLKQQGRTILFTTHYMDEAQRLCDRVAIMDHGRILAMDTVGHMLEVHGGQAIVEAKLKREPAEGVRLPGRREGTSVVIETDRPMDAIEALMKSGEPMESVQVRQADLERVFLNLTGRRLRD